MGSAGDGELVARARTGDEAAWHALYLRHHRRIVIWLTSMPSGDPAAEAEDIVADAWVVAAGKIGEFRGSDDEFGGWLLSIARNIAVNHRRRTGRRRTYATEDAGADLIAVDAPEQSVTGDDTARGLLAQLSKREAEVIACIDVVGLDVAATAVALGMSATAVRVARHRGLGRLRKILSAAPKAAASLPE